MALLVLSDDAVFYTWAAITWALTADAAVAMVRGWASGRRLRFEDIFAGPRAGAMLVSALLYQFGIRLLAVHVTIPEARRLRGGQDAVGLQASVERFLTDEANVWPVGGFFFGVVVLLILLAGVRRRRRAAPLPRAAAVGQGAGGGRVPLGEVLIFLVLLCGCVYSFPATVRDYMSATANGRVAAVAP